MGTISSNQMKCHIMIKEWTSITGLRESNQYEDDYEYEENYLLTLSGNLFVENYRYHWISKYEKNNLLNNLTILNFDLNRLVKKKIKSFIKNESKNKNHYGETIWELLNFKKDNNIKKGINIKENNVFRIGDQIFKVKMLILEKDKKKIKSKRKIKKAQKSQIFQNSKNVYDIINNLPKKLEKELVCRICLDKETKLNRFHNFCNCIKTMPTHLSCLQEWLKKNIIQNESNGITFYNFLNICCDICKEQFPSTYKNNKGNIIPLIKPNFPKGTSFIILELYLIEDPSIIKALIIFDMSFERMIHCGTDEESDIIFKHPSINLHHCCFILKKNGFYLFDKGSKFGSFLLFDNIKKLKKNKNYIFKIENNIIQIHPFTTKPCYCVKDFEYNKKEIPKDPYRLNIKYLLDNQRRVQSMRNLSKANNNKKNKLTSEKNIDNFHNSIHGEIKNSHNFDESIHGEIKNSHNFDESIHGEIKNSHNFDESINEEIKNSHNFDESINEEIKNSHNFDNSIHGEIKNSNRFDESDDEFKNFIKERNKNKSIFGSILEKSNNSFINDKSFLKKNKSVINNNESFFNKSKKNESIFRKKSFFNEDSFSIGFDDSENFNISGQYDFN